MNCQNCNNIISVEQTHCDVCGSDVLISIKIYKLSNFYYNKGLEKAKIRDLSGAADVLLRSLKVYKLNTDARNLLGLILFEMGETVAALSEWVISKHFQPYNNDAEHYMVMVQENPTKLDTKNQAIKKYNIALEAAQQGNDDLAVLQLKKVVSLNPNFLRAVHLLSLLYIKLGDFDRAYRLLNKTLKIDIANTTTLRYLSEIKFYLSDDNARDKLIESAPTASIIPITKYREEKPNVLAWVNWFLGMAIGIAITFILVVPTVKKNIRAEYNKEDLNYAAELNILNANISSDEKEIASLKMQIKDKEDEIARIRETEKNPQANDQFFNILLNYQAYLAEPSTKSEEELYLLAKEFESLSETIKGNENAMQLYDDTVTRLYPIAAKYAVEQGKNLYEIGRYDEAYDILSDAYLFQPDDDIILYNFGQACQMLEKFTEASTYYNLLMDEYPDSTLADDARKRMDEMGMR